MTLQASGDGRSKPNKLGWAVAQAEGLWPTPTTDSASDRSGRYAQGGMPLTAAVRLLPTPMAADGDRTSETFARGNATLLGAARLLPTPTANDAKQGANAVSQLTRDSLTSTVLSDASKRAGLLPIPRAEGFDAGGHRGRNDSLHATVKAEAPAQGALSPEFVEALMGYPIGWTDTALTA